MQKDARQPAIDLPSDPECLIQSLQSIGYTWYTDLADVIDHGIASYVNETSIRFNWNNKVL